MVKTILADLRMQVSPNYRGLGFGARVAAKALVTPGLHAVLMYRLSHVLYGNVLTRPLAFVVRMVSTVWAGTEIHPSARLGPGLCVIHGQKILIGPGVVAGRNLRISHGVSIGGDLGRGAAHNTSTPVLGDDVTIALDSIVLGPVTVGDGAVIAAQSLVMRDVEPYTMVAGSPARMVRRVEGGVPTTRPLSRDAPPT